VLVLYTSAFVNLFPGELGIEHVQGGEVFDKILWVLVYLSPILYCQERMKELIAWCGKEKRTFLIGLGFSFGRLVDRQAIDDPPHDRLLATFFVRVYLGCRYRPA